MISVNGDLEIHFPSQMTRHYIAGRDAITMVIKKIALRIVET